MGYYNTTTNDVETVWVTLALLDKMPRCAVEFLAEWWGELFDSLTVAKVEQFITYDNGETWDTLDELAQEWGYEDYEDMTGDYYTVLTDAAFPGAIIIE